MEFFKKARNLAAGALTFGAASAIEPDFSTYTLSTPTAEARRLNPEVATDIGEAITLAMQYDAFLNDEVQKVPSGRSAVIQIGKGHLDRIVAGMAEDGDISRRAAIAYCQNVTHATAIIDKSRGGLIFTVTYFEGTRNKGTTTLRFRKD